MTLKVRVILSANFCIWRETVILHDTKGLPFSSPSLASGFSPTSPHSLSPMSRWSCPRTVRPFRRTSSAACSIQVPFISLSLHVHLTHLFSSLDFGLHGSFSVLVNYHAMDTWVRLPFSLITVPFFLSFLFINLFTLFPCLEGGQQGWLRSHGDARRQSTYHERVPSDSRALLRRQSDR